MARGRLPSELYLPFDVPTLRQIDVEKGRNMNPKAINVGPFMIIRSIVNPAFPRYRMRIVTCRTCPNMGDAAGTHWHKECTTLPYALEIAGNHIKSCHSVGACNEC